MRENTGVKKIILIILLLALMLTTILATYIIQRNQSPTDSEALFGGSVESGYPSAGFLITDNRNGGSKYCGYVAINARVGITAGHCVDDASGMYLGKGEFSFDKTKLIKVDKAVQKSGWADSKLRPDDFAVLNFRNSDGYLRDYAEVASPVEGCRYRVVAYGRTEDPSSIANPPRKSAALCASEITSKVFTVTGYGTGLCFGDSGSPVFYEGTNKVVGVIASIIKKDGDNNENPCSFSNTAIVVRVDSNASLINENVQVAEPNAPDIEIINGFTVEVASDTLLGRIGLSRLENLSDDEKFNLSIGVIILMIIVILVLIVVLLRRPDKKRYIEI